MIAWHNGELTSQNEAQNSALSAGTLLGWGVFTTIGVWNGRAFALPQHLRRLRNGTQTARMELLFPDSELAVALDKVLRANRISRGIARISVTRRGDGRWKTEDGTDVLILAQTFNPSTAQMQVCLSPYHIESRRPLCGVKSTSYLDHQLAWLEASDQGFDETILRNSQGFLCEAARSNLFWVKDGVLRTPALSSGCLPGIARAIVLQGAQEMGIHSEEGLFDIEELQTADEVFLTSAAQGPRVVNQFTGENNQTFEYSKEKVAARFIDFWDKCVKRETEKI